MQSFALSSAASEEAFDKTGNYMGNCEELLWHTTCNISRTELFKKRPGDSFKGVVMRAKLTVLASILALGSATLFADPIPYANPGTIAPTTPVSFAGATGTSITAYFYSVSAGDDDTISILDATTGNFLIPTGAFPNHSSTVGSMVSFTAATGQTLSTGDMLVFELNNVSAGGVFASDPSYSSDNTNHAYITPFSGSITNVSGLVTGTYVGMEDLPNGSSDFDYNDDTFVFTQVASAPTPEPGSFILLGTGLLGIAGTIRRRFVR